MVTSDLRAEVEIWPFRACVMHPAIIIGIPVCSLWTWLWADTTSTKRISSLNLFF